MKISSKLIRLIGLFFLLSVILILILSTHIVHDTRRAFDLSEKQRLKLEVLANTKKDSMAAERLGDYYMWSIDDLEQARKWYRYSADLGNAQAEMHVLDLENILKDRNKK